MYVGDGKENIPSTTTTPALRTSVPTAISAINVPSLVNVDNKSHEDVLIFDETDAAP
jgi:hypothetical protein